MLGTSADGELEFSLVVPVYNERENIRPLADRVRSTCEALFQGGWELILVDDASTDGSSEAMDEVAAEQGEIRAFHFVKNAGQSAALEAGFSRARGRFIGVTDADLQTHPEDLGLLYEVLKREGVDAAIGIRAHRKDTAWKRFSSKFANGVRNRLTHEDIVDTGCPLKIFRREAILSICLFNGAHRFFPTMLKMKGFTVAQVPVRHTNRQWGKSKYGTLDRAFRGLHDAIGVRWLQKRALQWEIGEQDKA